MCYCPDVCVFFTATGSHKVQYFITNVYSFNYPAKLTSLLIVMSSLVVVVVVIVLLLLV